MTVAGPRGDDLAAGLAERDFTGVVLAVGPDGLLAAATRGVADLAMGRLITVRSRFGIASAAKLFTAVTIGYLVPPGGEPGGVWRSNLYAIPARGRPDGGAFAPAADLVRFLDAFREGRLLGAAWRDEMVRPRVRDEREEVDYGLAWWRQGEGRGRWGGHPGGDPGYVAQVRWYPEAGVRLIVLANRSNRAGSAAALAEALLVG